MAKVLIGMGSDADWRAKLYQVMEGNLGRVFTIECAETDKSSHVPPSGDAPTRLSWCGCVAAAGE